MKCPKCNYLGFETGDRCKNCGYDFSLMAAPGSADLDLPLNQTDPLAPLPLDTLAAPTAAAAAAVTRGRAMQTAPAGRATPSLPLFSPASDMDDAPLVKLPATPRAPLAVRKTPQKARLRTAVQELEFAGADVVEPPPAVAREPQRTAAPRSAASRQPAGAVRWLTAGILDHLILLAIDLTVVYFTLKMAALSVSEWRVLPIAPLLAFLLIIKATYFYLFTLVGGQTIGKMAIHIRVIRDDNGTRVIRS